MQRVLGTSLLAGAATAALWHWYTRETMLHGMATVHLQSEHEHFHLHVDLPSAMEIEPGDTLIIETMPEVAGETHGEITYTSPVQLHKASWLRRNLVKRSSLVEISELVDHP